MKQSLIGILVLVAGAVLILNRNWFFGIACVVFGVGIINGARHEAWISFQSRSSDDSGGDGDGGGGDGGGGD